MVVSLQDTLHVVVVLVLKVMNLVTSQWMPPHVARRVWPPALERDMVVSLLETLHVVVVLVLMNLVTSQWMPPRVARRVWPALERDMVGSRSKMLLAVFANMM